MLYGTFIIPAIVAISGSGTAGPAEAQIFWFGHP